MKSEYVKEEIMIVSNFTDLACETEQYHQL